MSANMDDEANQALQRALHQSNVYVGPIKTDGPGRFDNVDMNVAADSFVIPADVVSALGQGNSEAGYRVLDHLFGPHGVTERADGGQVQAVPIVAAGGEYVVSPGQVARVGSGNPKRGHSILDGFVRQVRADHIKTLKKLPGPARK
jgi:hypothetical protein